MTAAQQLKLTGFVCECGMEHDYPAYVFAHWRESLVHTCPNCNRKHLILEGKATLIDTPSEPIHKSGGCVVVGEGA